MRKYFATIANTRQLDEKSYEQRDDFIILSIAFFSHNVLQEVFNLMEEFIEAK